MKDIQNFINGAYVSTGRSFDKHSPLTGQVIAKVHEAGRSEVDAAVAAARTALNGPWGRMSVAERVEKLYALADGIAARTSIAVHLDADGWPDDLRTAADHLLYSAAREFSTNAIKHAHAVRTV